MSADWRWPACSIVSVGVFPMPAKRCPREPIAVRDGFPVCAHHNNDGPFNYDDTDNYGGPVDLEEQADLAALVAEVEAAPEVHL